jgi:hypothetical protein
MAAIDFPNSPEVDDLFTQGDITWQWDGTVWRGLGTTATGPAGVTISDDEPESNQVLWLDTDEEPDVPVPAGGSAGQVLSKTSSTDYDTQWSTSDGVRVFADATARTSAIATPAEGMVSYLNNIDSIQTYNGSAWVTTSNAGVASYSFVQTLQFTSTSTFTKATYPWLRALRVRCIGGGGGGGGTTATSGTEYSTGQGGGGAAHSESFIIDIAGLSSSITVTVGAGGTGVSGAAGNSGGTSSFGSLVTATGGSGGSTVRQSAKWDGFGSLAGTLSGSVGDLVIPATVGSEIKIDPNSTLGTRALSGSGGNSFIGPGASYLRDNASSSNGANANFNGGGGGGAVAGQSQSAKTGGTGGAGRVIIELFA